MNIYFKQANPGTGLVAGFLMLFQACVSAPQTKLLLQQSISLPPFYEIQNVPFFPQEDYFCGPTTLAEILQFYALDIEPETVAPNLFIPGRKGSLQIEMVSSIRQFGLLAYAEQGDVAQLLSLINEDIPIIVLQNQGLSWYPLWHYALVIGYDLEAEKIILHTGVNEGRIVAMDLFESTWKKGGYWMLAVLPPEKNSKHFDPFLYISAAQDLMAVGQEQAGIKALASASNQWSEYWLSYFLLGNYYLQDSPGDALNWFQKGSEAGGNIPSYLNNYAYAALYNDCAPQALKLIQRAIGLDPDNPTLQDSLTDIRQALSEQQVEQTNLNSSCSI